MYIKTFFSDIQVGALTSTSKYCIKKVSDKIQFAGKKLIVEYGSGAGEFTKVFLKKMDPDAKLIAFETNPDFIRKMQEIKDERLIIVPDSAENVRSVMKSHGFTKADYIVSGIPLTLIPGNIRKKIVSESIDLLSEDGELIFYQYSFYVKKLLKPYLKDIDISLSLLNFPPMFIISAKNKLSPKTAKTA